MTDKVNVVEIIVTRCYGDGNQLRQIGVFIAFIIESTVVHHSCNNIPLEIITMIAHKILINERNASEKPIGPVTTRLICKQVILIHQVSEYPM